MPTLLHYLVTFRDKNSLLLYSNKGAGRRIDFQYCRRREFMPYRITEDCKGCGHCVQWCPTKAIKGRRRVGYTIESKRCIDCGVCGRICTYSAVLQPDGNYATRLRRSHWNRPQWEYDSCTNCDLCISACPVKCIKTAEIDEPGMAMLSGYPYLSRPRMCIGCGFCSEACAENTIQMQPAEFSAAQTSI